MKLRSLEVEQDQNRMDNEKQIRIPIVGLCADMQQSAKESRIKARMDEYMTEPLPMKGLARARPAHPTILL
ncbi:hypothetical protein BGX34_003165 [Mortierella sp. NVP85]|nr:hypothetical protein BGX34_003165 [Mortierella sp. NVP85]